MGYTRWKGGRGLTRESKGAGGGAYYTGLGGGGGVRLLLVRGKCGGNVYFVKKATVLIVSNQLGLNYYFLFSR